MKYAIANEWTEGMFFEMSPQRLRLEAELERLMKERDTANALLAEALTELDTIEALTVSPTDVDGLMDLVKRMRAHLEGR